MVLRAGLVGCLLAVAALTASCNARLCGMCDCPSPDVIICDHMSIEMTSIPGPSHIPSTTVKLELSGNSFHRIGNNAFSTLTQLKILILSDNEIQSVASDAFAGLSSLEILDLSHNDITSFPDGIFRDLPNLKELILHDNGVNVLTKETFQDLKNLQTLDLSDNQLTQVSSSMFAAMGDLDSLNMNDNPLHCDCSLAWVRLFTPLQSDLLTCTSPDHLSGRLVSSLTFNELRCVVPSVIPVAPELYVYDGHSLLLECAVDGASEDDLMWLLNGQNVTGLHNVYILSNGSLYIANMTMSLGGHYTCVAQNMAGTGTANISVVYLGLLLPRVLVTPSSTHAFPGENVTLRCLGDHYTDSYQWLYEGQPLSPSSRIHVEVGVGLHIQNVNIEDSGLYTCVCMGSEGSVNASAILSVTGPLLSCAGVITAATVDSIRSMVHFAFNSSSPRAVSSPHQLLRQLKLPDNGSIELLMAGEVFQELLQAVRNNHSGNSSAGLPSLSSCEVTLLAELSGCLEHGTTPNCSDTCFHNRYRSIDGSCNNRDNPLWGMTDTPFLRLLPPAYEDGLGLPVGWSVGELPSARGISQSVIRAHSVEADIELTHMLMQIGQFLDHDLDLAPGIPGDVAFSSGAMCDSQCSNIAPCFPIPVPDDDPRLTGECLPFTRSGGVCGTGSPSVVVGSSAFYRNQLNAITSFMDASQIYGSTPHHAQQLRDPTPARHGYLLEGEAGPGGKPFLPFDRESLIECSTGINTGRSDCFLAGDVRANEQVGLTTMHTIFFREHNRIASYLEGINPHWDQETLFQETRKVVIAEWQHIIFNEYLPKIIGPSRMSSLRHYHGYDPTVNPTISNAFATAAYRFGHSQIMPVFERLDENYQPHSEGHLLLRDAFFAPFRLLEGGGVESLLRGLIASGVKRRSSISGLNSNLTEALFAQANEVALDLASLNIQRGRDHGLPSYLTWRQYCGLQTEDPLADIGHRDVRQRLEDIYGDVETIDLWVGGLLETLEEGSQLGPTFNCIISDQFVRLRDGDRFWFERPGQFSPDQLLQLKKSSLSRIICDNADSISQVPRDAFLLQPVSEFSDCSNLPSVDLDLWTDCKECTSENDRERRSVLLSSVAEEVQHLKEVVGHLEEKAGSCRMNGVQYHHNDEWSVGPCTHCTCKMGDAICQEEHC